MLDTKEIIGIIAVALTFVGYIPYFIDVVAGKTKPHLFSWLVWCVTTAIICALQISAGAGPGAWVTVSLTLVFVVMFGLSFKYGHKDIRRIDVVFLILALCALPLWLVVHQPVLSIILLSTIDMLGFAPTIRKSWNNPYTETLAMYGISTFRHGIVLLALSSWSIVTYLFPLTWVIANGGFAILLIARRRIISNQK
jgi:hypothetical protein